MAPSQGRPPSSSTHVVQYWSGGCVGLDLASLLDLAAAGQHAEPGFGPVPRIQIVTIEDAMRLRERAVQLPARRADSFRRAAREEDHAAQGRLEL